MKFFHRYAIIGFVFIPAGNFIMTASFSTSKDRFVSYLSSRGRACATIVAYTKDIDQLVTFLTTLEKKTLDEVKQEEIEAFLKKMKSGNFTAKTISRKLNSIKTFFRYLISDGLIHHDPASAIDHPKFEIKPPRILSKLEYRALRDACKDDVRTYTIVELFLQTGIRIGELAELTVNDIYNGELNIRAQEGHETRTVPLNNAAKEALDKYLSTRNGNVKNSALFVTKTGKGMLIRNIRTMIDRYFREAGIEDAKVNDLRNTFIAHHLMAGTPLATISKMVGHKRTATTEKYLELVKDLIGKEKMKAEEL